MRFILFYSNCDSLHDDDRYTGTRAVTAKRTLSSAIGNWTLQLSPASPPRPAKRARTDPARRPWDAETGRAASSRWSAPSAVGVFVFYYYFFLLFSRKFPLVARVFMPSPYCYIDIILLRIARTPLYSITIIIVTLYYKLTIFQNARAFIACWKTWTIVRMLSVIM